MNSFSAVSSLVVLFAATTHACRTISMQSEVIGDLEFELANVDLRQGESSHRPVYISEAADGGVLYLYHISAVTDIPGKARWVINNDLYDKETAISFVDSWAVAPHLVQAVNDVDKVGWMVDVDGNGNWGVDETLMMYCSDDTDRTIFFDSPYVHKTLSGFFTQAYGPSDQSYVGPLFVKVNVTIFSPM